MSFANGRPLSTILRPTTPNTSSMLLICTASNGKNLVLAQELARLAGELSIEHQLLDLVDLDWPLYTPARQESGAPEDFASIDALFHSARAFVFCAPEYNGSIPPALTSLIAWLSVAGDDFRTLFNGKPSALATHSGGGGQKVLVAMRLQLSHLGSNVLGRELITNKGKPLNEDSARQILGQLASALG